MCTIRFIGLDVHKDTIVISVADAGNAETKVEFLISVESSV